MTVHVEASELQSCSTWEPTQKACFHGFGLVRDWGAYRDFLELDSILFWSQSWLGWAFLDYNTAVNFTAANRCMQVPYNITLQKFTMVTVVTPKY